MNFSIINVIEMVHFVVDLVIKSLEKNQSKESVVYAENFLNIT